LQARRRVSRLAARGGERDDKGAQPQTKPGADPYRAEPIKTAVGPRFRPSGTAVALTRAIAIKARSDTVERK
jgi:hypothetical protein